MESNLRILLSAVLCDALWLLSVLSVSHSNPQSAGQRLLALPTCFQQVLFGKLFQPSVSSKNHHGLICITGGSTVLIKCNLLIISRCFNTNMLRMLQKCKEWYPSKRWFWQSCLLCTHIHTGTHAFIRWARAAYPSSHVLGSRSLEDSWTMQGMSEAAQQASTSPPRSVRLITA